jgi:hypothetical protein
MDNEIASELKIMNEYLREITNQLKEISKELKIQSNEIKTTSDKKNFEYMFNSSR